MIICGSKCRAERQLGLADILTHPQAEILFPNYSFFLTHQTTLGLEIQRGQIPACSTDPLANEAIPLFAAAPLIILDRPTNRSFDPLYFYLFMEAL